MYFESLGEDFQRFESAYDVQQRTKLIFDLLPDGRRFARGLEVGCGMGSITRSVMSRADHYTVSDISKKMAEHVGTTYDCSWSQADACNLPFDDDAYDLVVSSECIEHTPDPLKAVREMARVLQPGGHLIITTPNRLWYPVLALSQLLKIRKFEGNEIWVWPGQVANALRENRCDVVQISGCHLVPWQVPGAKWLLPSFDKSGRYLYRLMINFGILAVKR